MNITFPESHYKNDGNVTYNCQYHVVFCTKFRRKVLEGDILTDLQQMIMSKQEEFGYELQDLEILSEHVHLVMSISPELSVHNVIGKIKGYTSHVLREKYESLCSRLPTLWTRVYFLSTVGTVPLRKVDDFLEEQKSR